MAKALTFIVTVVAEPQGDDIDPQEVGSVLHDEIDSMGGIWATDDEHDDEMEYSISVTGCEAVK